MERARKSPDIESLITSLDAKAIAKLDPQTKSRLREMIRERQDRVAQCLFDYLYTDDGVHWPGPSIQKGLIQPGQFLHSWKLYPKHMEFFEVGAKYTERGVLAANRIGKSFGMGGYETACHLTGLYPHWWKGRRFDAPVSAWAAGKTLQTTRNIMQLTLLGTVKRSGQRKTVDGRGVIPGRAIIQDSIAWRSGGVSDLVDTVLIKHVSGGYSDLGFLSYDQGRGVFEGTGKQVVWLDEEPPADVYSECLTRTATTRGMIYITFTPLEGLSSVVLSFLPGEQNADLIKVD